MILISADVTNPTLAPFIVADHKIINLDGSESYFVSATGLYAGQEPNAYGVRNDNPHIEIYQKFTRAGALVTTIPRPGDRMFVYTIAEGQSY